MASKRNTKKSSTFPNQPHSREVKDSATTSNKPFVVPSDFISSQFIERYPPDIPTQPIPGSSYSSSPDISHQDSSSNEQRGVSSEEPLYLIQKTEVNQLCHHTRSFLKSLGQIPIVYKIPISRASQRRTQRYGDGETLTSIIDDLIVDTIFEIHQPITDIAHFRNFKDLEF